MISFLNPISQIVVPGTDRRFVAKEVLVRDISSGARIKINHLSDNFTRYFCSGDGKVEEPIEEQALRRYELWRSPADNLIIAALGGMERAKTTLYEMSLLMEKQRQGESGILLNNGYGNIFYIEDQKSILRSVGVYWRDDDRGYRLDADPVEGPPKWHCDYQVFSS